MSFNAKNNKNGFKVDVQEQHFNLFRDSEKGISDNQAMFLSCLVEVWEQVGKDKIGIFTDL